MKKAKLNSKDYIEIDGDGSAPTYYKFDAENKAVISRALIAKEVNDCDYEFSFSYKVPTETVTLSLLQVEDLISFYKIYLDNHPCWRKNKPKLFQTKAVD